MLWIENSTDNEGEDGASKGEPEAAEPLSSSYIRLKMGVELNRGIHMLDFFLFGQPFIFLECFVKASVGGRLLNKQLTGLEDNLEGK